MRVLLVDDHPLFLHGLRNLLTSRGMTVVGEAHDGLEALDQARAHSPDMILMDVHMPRCDGVTATRLIKAERPETKVVMLTMSEEDRDLFAAIKSGACGYLCKSLDTDEFLALLSGAEHGEMVFSPGLAAKILREFAQPEPGHSPEPGEPASTGSLSPRQVEVLTLVAHGLTYKQVAARLGLSERTIKHHMGEIVGLLHLESRAEVVDFARRQGLLRT